MSIFGKNKLPHELSRGTFFSSLWVGCQGNIIITPSRYLKSLGLRMCVSVCFFFFGCAGSSLLLEFFSSCDEQWLLVGGLLAVVASLTAEHWLQDVQASVAVTRGLSCSMACGICWDQGLNLCLPHRHADSLALSHQGSSRMSLI